MRLIDADALIDTIDKAYPNLDRQDMKQWIEKAPTKYNKGKWLEVELNEVECSECGHREKTERFIFEDINFCSYCGADMREN